MSKIVSMSSGAIDPIAQSKRVFFRPSSADTVRVGDLVCYNWDIDTDHKERTADPTHIGLTEHTYADGAQDKTGRLFIVEKPATANLHAFAGVVKALGPKAGADDDMIEIWIPNGAVLPVMCDIETTNGRTIVGVRDGAYEGSYPGRPIGIARESKDRSETDGLVWVKVDPSMFVWVEGDDAALIIDDEGSSDITLNKIKVTNNQTTGSTGIFSVVLNTVNTDGGSAMYWEYGNTGTGAGGMKLINAYVEAAGTAIAADVVGMKMQVNLLAGSGSTTAATTMAIFAKVHVKASCGTHSGAICAGRFSLGLDTAVTGITAQLEFEHTSNAAQTVDYLFDAIYKTSIGAVACGQHTNHDTSDIAIKVRIEGSDYYIIAQDSTG